MDGAQQEIAGPSPHGAYFEVERAHAKSGGCPAAHGHSAIQHAPNHGAWYDKPEQRPSKSQSEEPEHEDGHAREHHRNGDDGDVDQERKRPPRRHILEQLRLCRHPVAAPRIEVETDASWTYIGHLPYAPAASCCTVEMALADEPRKGCFIGRFSQLGRRSKPPRRSRHAP